MVQCLRTSLDCKAYVGLFALRLMAVILFAFALNTISTYKFAFAVGWVDLHATPQIVDINGNAVDSVKLDQKFKVRFTIREHNDDEKIISGMRVVFVAPSGAIVEPH